MCVRVWLLKSERREKRVGQKLPNQRKKTTASGEKRRELANREKRENGLANQRKRKEERRESEKRRKKRKRVGRTRDPRARPVGFFIHLRRNFSMFPVSYFKPTLGKPSMIFPLPIPSQIWRDLVLKLGKTHKRVRWLCVFDSLIFETFSFNC